MGLIRDVERLNDDFRPLAKEWLAKLDEVGIKYRVIETLRTMEVQTAYYAQGRKPLADVNALRKLAGLWTITDLDNKRRITWTLQSNHLWGAAIDVAPLNGITINWGAPFHEWEAMAKYAEEIGISWGGRWEQQDLPHYELKRG